MMARKKRFIAAAGLVVISLSLAVWLFVPTAAIQPGSSGGEVALGSPIEIHASSLGQITKMAVYADGQLLGMEYNLGTNDLVREFDLKPGQEVRVEAKITTPLGITREFTSSFNTVAPVKIESMSIDGAPYKPGQRIPPQPTLMFSFNKPLTEAGVSLDGSDAIELQVDSQDPTKATLPPTVSLRQGDTHLLKISATAADSAILEPQSLRAAVVKPLTLYGKVDENGGQVRIELDSTTPFADPEAVKTALETTLPSPDISVEKQKIIITCPSLDYSSDYSIKLARAEGADGSFLETPLTLTVNFKGATSVAASGESGSRGYIYTPGTSGTGGTVSGPTSTGSTGSTGGGDSGGGSTGGSGGPPPGWPPCCPWPPQ